MKTKNGASKMIGLVLTIFLSTTCILAQQTRSLGDFSGIKTSGTFDIIISQSDANTVKVEADEKEQQNIKTEIKDGILVITNNSGSVDKPIKIGVKSLSSLNISGSGDIKTDNQLICDKLSIESSGAGDIHISVKASEIKAHISGAGDVTLKGTAQLLDADVSGAGDLRASNLLVDKAKVKVSGAGDGKVNVKQTLDADVSGAGDVIYKGKPVDRNINISGAGSVRESKSGNGDETASDTTKLKFGKKKFVIIGDGKDDEDDEEYVSSKDSLKKLNEGFKNWTGIEVGINGLLNTQANFNTPAHPATVNFLELNYSKSIQFGINLLEKNFHIYKNYVNLVTGFGFDFTHYALQNNVTLNPNSKYLQASNDTMNYHKNSLNVSYVKVPLMIEFNTGKNPKNNFHIAVGAEFEYRIHSVLKQKFDVGDEHFKTKERDDYNLAPFVYSAVARIGYNGVTAFANYGLNGLFRNDQGPLATPFMVGVNLSF